MKLLHRERFNLDDPFVNKSRGNIQLYEVPVNIKVAQVYTHIRKVTLFLMNYVINTTDYFLSDLMSCSRKTENIATLIEGDNLITLCYYIVFYCFICV